MIEYICETQLGPAVKNETLDHCLEKLKILRMCSEHQNFQNMCLKNVISFNFSDSKISKLSVAVL